MTTPPTVKPDTMTLADHAEAWWRESGKIVPARNTDEWSDMYKRWISYAFDD